MLPCDLEDWLTDEGGKVVDKAVAFSSRDALTASERLLYELWLFDTEQRNGGVSQYFANRGLEQWDAFSRLAAPALPSFLPFATKVNDVVYRSENPYAAVMGASENLDAWYMEHQTRMASELRAILQVEAT